MVVVVCEGRCVDFDNCLYMPGDSIDLPDKEVDRLNSKGVVKEVDNKGIDEDNKVTETPVLTNITIAGLKVLLNKLGVSYDTKSRKDELISLVKANTGIYPCK